MLDRIETLLSDTCLAATDWERSFLESVKQQAKTRSLSSPQVSALERIENKNTPELRATQEAFAKRWSSNEEGIKDLTHIVCRYYEQTGYFQALTHKILDRGLAPNLGEYEKLCENKYALRVMEEHSKEPRYAVNSLVQIRKTNTINKNFRHQHDGYIKLGDAYALVIEVNALPISRAAKGAKVYKILPVGASRTYYVSESDIKRARKVK